MPQPSRSSAARVRRAALTAAALTAAALLLGCAESGPSAPIFSTDRGAIDGTDAVAYFSEGRALRGDPAIWTEWRGARWHFASPENRERFRADPERYAPRFGGYCAYGVASGYAVASDPEAWGIWRDRLYLNYDRETLEEWEKNREEMLPEAERNWPGVLR